MNFRAVGAVLRGTDGKPSLIGGAMFNEGLTVNVDPVTILPNKHAYLEELKKMMGTGKRTFSLQVGISDFSDINETHGYTYGNRILQEITWLIQETVGKRGNVYRTDGATFVFLTSDLNRGEVAAIYDMIRYQLQRGVEINGIRNILSANGGMVSTFGAETESSMIYSCLHYAYEESRVRKHGELVDFNGNINYKGPEGLKLFNVIRDCVSDGCRGFALEYEPVIDARTGHVNGAETKIYWKDERHGRVDLSQFMPVLEKDFIFEEVGDFILRQGFQDGMKFLEKDPGFLLCLNVYRIQLESGYFIENLLYFLQESGFPAHLLSLKFTSDCRYVEPACLYGIIEKLHANQILVIIDGFGSEGDSIRLLKNAPVDAVCLDDQFIRGIEENSRDRDILKYLTEMAATCVKHINLKGIDTEAICKIVREFPITTMQGAYFSVPLTFEQMLAVYDK